MTKQEVDKLNIVINGITYTSDYDCTEIEKEDGTEFDYTITKTAQEVYELTQQIVTPQPNTEEILLAYVADLDYRLSLKEMGL